MKMQSDKYYKQSYYASSLAEYFKQHLCFNVVISHLFNPPVEAMEVDGGGLLNDYVINYSLFSVINC